MGESLHDVRLQEVTEESTTRNNGKLPPALVMGVRKDNGIVPMKERLVAADISRYKVVRPNWFAYNPMRLNIGSIARWQGGSDILVSPDYVVFRCLERSTPAALHPDYLDHFRNSKQWNAFVNEAGDGGVRVRIYYNDISQMRLALPDFVEQKKIADCLDSLDDVIAAEGRKLGAMRQHKQGLMQQLFPLPGETVPRLRFSEFRDAGEWEERKLGELSEVKASGDLDPAHFSDLQSTTHMYPVYSNAVENAGLFGYYSLAQYERNSVTITARGTLGVAFVREDQFMGIGRLIVVSDFRNLDPSFLKECWNHLAVIPSEVTSIPQLTAVAVRATVLPIPRLAEQQRIAACLSSLNDVLAAQVRLIDALKTHKQGLMQQLFPSLEEA
jgi:type I restriction enzyme S subunit